MPQQLTESDIFALLAKRRRRLLLRILQESDSPPSVSELAERIEALEDESPSDEAQRTIYLSLYHNHLPRLEEADVVRYDRAEGTVAPDVNFHTIVRFLAQTNARDVRWHDE